MVKTFVTGSRGYWGAIVEAITDTVGPVDVLAGRLSEIRPKSLDYDCVVHCAAALRHRVGQHAASNAEGTRQLLAGLTKETRVVYLSSRAVYAPSDDDLTEASPIGPIDEYGSTKLRGEEFVRLSGHPFLILRVGGVFGVGNDQAGIAFPTIAARKLLDGAELTLYTPPRPHDYLYVKDLAQWIAALIPPGPHWGNIFNVAGRSRPLDQLIDQIADEVAQSSGRVPAIVRKPGPPPRAPYLDATKLRTLLPTLEETSDIAVVRELVGFLIHATA